MNGLGGTIRQMLAVWLKKWPLWVVVYAANLLPALALALLPALGLLQMSRLTVLNDAARGISLSMLADALSSVSSGSPGLPGVGTLSLSVLVVGLAVPFTALLAGAFLVGGVYRSYIPESGPITLRRFLRDCLHWFFPALAVDLLLGLVVILLLVVAILAVPLLASFLPLLGWAAATVLILVFIFTVVMAEMVQAAMAVQNTRSLGAAAGSAFRFVFHKPLVFLAVMLASLGLLAAVHLLFRWLLPLVPGSMWLLMLLVTQAFVLARVSARLLRSAGQVQVLLSYPR